MDRHQDKNYEAEQVEIQGAVLNDEPMNDMRYFLELIKAIRETILDGRGTRRWKLVDVDTCLNILDDLNENLPVAIQYGLQMYSERERILGNSETEARDRITTAEMRANATLEDAKRKAEMILSDAQYEADNIVAEAKERADFMVSEDEILRRAREEANSILNDARVEAHEERLRVNHEMLQTVTQVGEELSMALGNITRSRQDLENKNIQ